MGHFLFYLFRVNIIFHNKKVGLFFLFLCSHEHYRHPAVSIRGRKSWDLGYSAEAVSRGVQGGGATPLSKSGGCEGPPCAPHPPDWPWGGCRGPPCDIWLFWQRFLYNLHKLHLLKIKFPKIPISLFKLKMTINTLKNLLH